MKEQDRNWFRPLWRRVLVTALIAVWCAWEWFWNKDQLWSLLTLAMLAYAIWSFFITFGPDDRPPSGTPPSA